HPNCRHAKRMTLLAAADAANGVAAVETIVSLSKYYASFGQPRHEFNPDPRQCTGPKDAKVTLVEFSDFECPFCGAARPLLESFVKTNGKVRFCWMAFPLSAHPNAIPAATAALFARDHGKFWEMHDALFDNQMSLSPETIKQLAAKIGLDPNALGKAMADNAYGDALAASKEAGRKAGVDSTPSLYLNGRKHNMSIDEATLGHAVDDEIEWMTNKGWAPDQG
ncbi:MAG: DsbA family protein, partial [Myxococcaceae bacterium]